MYVPIQNYNRFRIQSGIRLKIFKIIVFLGQDGCWSGPTSRYNGTKAETKSGFTCQKWLSDVPHKPKHRPKDATTENDHNHCRYVPSWLELPTLVITQVATLVIPDANTSYKI